MLVMMYSRATLNDGGMRMQLYTYTCEFLAPGPQRLALKTGKQANVAATTFLMCCMPPVPQTLTCWRILHPLAGD